MIKKAHEILRNIYGYNEFRKGQEIIIDSILSGNNTVGILTTGGGKSICYQIPALIFQGITIVISPLISLMKDQVDSLRILGIGAVTLNSNQTQEEYISSINQIKNGNAKIIYVAPERLNNEKFINFIKQFQISLIAVDEAHCISMWGHDFRETYLEIPKFIQKIGQNNIKILALTATATKRVRDDIIEKLNLIKPTLFIGGFDRKNIYFEVKKSENSEYDIAKFIKEHKEMAGVIYASTRKEVDSLYAYLKEIHNINIGKYHAGMDENERNRNQELFSKDDIKVMVATNAFGMGIDKSNIRYVIHKNIPSDIESYYQEAGRAGRDGAPARAILYFSQKDIGIQKYFINSNKKTNDDLKFAKLEKLDKIIKYANNQHCLREMILKYFGDKRIKNFCGNCSNCKDLKNVKDVTIEAQKILSCVGRANEMVGISTIVSILKGRMDEKIKKKHFDELSTFGIMKEKSSEWIEEFINFLLIEKYVEQSAGSYPVLKLNNRSREIFKNKISVKRKDDEIITYNHFDNEIFKNLTELRSHIAREEKVAPYTIFSDMTLIEMSEIKPTNRWEMLKIPGVGNQKYKNYGEQFLKILRNGEKIDVNIDYDIFSNDEKIENLKKDLNLDVENTYLKNLLYNTFIKS